MLYLHLHLNFRHVWSEILTAWFATFTYGCVDLIKVATEIFASKVSASNLDLGTLAQSLQELLPISDGGLDVSALVSMFTKDSASLAHMAQSWLGDSQNDALDLSDVLRLFGESNITSFASKIGLDPNEAAGGLSQMIPDLIDKSSEGGELVSDIGTKLASSLLKGFF